MNILRPIDLAVLVVYLLGIAVLGARFAGRGRTLHGFVAASGRLPGWAVGLSLFGTFLSSNTFLGVPGKAFGTDWNSFVFSLSLPLAAWIAVRWFVPFFRRSGEVSAYTHFERRFGRWARVYAVVCYLLTQLARVGTILFGIALVLSPLTGVDPAWIIVITGGVVIFYTLRGIEAVIWTDVVQSFILVAGALIVVASLALDMPGGLGRTLDIAVADHKLSLGSYGAGLGASTFWVVLVYGLFINLNNFGIDQSYVQRYHAARGEREAARSVWLAALLYLPISMLFFWIGTALYADFRAQPELWSSLLTAIPEAEAGSPAGVGSAAELAAVADRAFPYFIVHRLPPGLTGLLVAALVAAGMSSIDTSLNSSATVIHADLLSRRLADAADGVSLRALRCSTVGVGILGTGAALAMIGVKSLLDAWWTLSGAFAGGLLGLFLLGMLVRRAARVEAAIAVTIGVIAILWMTLSPRLPESAGMLRSALHTNLTIVVGTLAIFLVGLACTTIRRSLGVSGA